MTEDAEPTESRTLDELDPPAWGAASYDSNLVRRCHELRRIPLGEFDVEDYRIMIGQEISLPILIPRAIDILETNPLAEGDLYAGDLLNAVLRVDKSYWHTNVDHWQTVDGIINRLTSALEHMRDSITAFRSSTFT